MTLIYIKFRHPNDIYALDPSYDLRPGDAPVPPKVCGRCGDTLYLPVELSEGVEISQPMGDIYRPLPKEKLDLIIRGDAEPITIRVYKNTSYEERQRLKQFAAMTYVNADGFEMLIDGVSLEPVEHNCPVPPYPKNLTVWEGKAWKGLSLDE